MRTSILIVAATASLAFANATQAAVVTPGSSGITPDDFALIAPTQGTELDTATISGTVGTFSAIIRAAVYRNRFREPGPALAAAI